MSKHESYENKFNRTHDFTVRYELLAQKEHEVIITQGMRSDFCFEGEYLEKGYMVWPEFEDEEGCLIEDSEETISKTGTARMWVLVEQSRPELQSKIKVGEKGYFLFGSHKVAYVEIIDTSGFWVP